MSIENLVKEWFHQWEKGTFLNLPISESFRHISPFGIIEGKTKYIHLIEENKEKFLGYTFKIHDEIYNKNTACIRYTALQNDFSLAVSEWHYKKNHLIEKVVAYYHIGEIRSERQFTFNTYKI